MYSVTTYTFSPWPRAVNLEETTSKHGTLAQALQHWNKIASAADPDLVCVLLFDEDRGTYGTCLGSWQREEGKMPARPYPLRT